MLKIKVMRGAYAQHLVGLFQIEEDISHNQLHPGSFCHSVQPAPHSFLQQALRYEWLQCFLQQTQNDNLPKLSQQSSKSFT
jgi:hypothetical protein